MCFPPHFLLQSSFVFCLLFLIAAKFEADGFTNHIINPANTSRSKKFAARQTFPIPNRFIYQFR